MMVTGDPELDNDYSSHSLSAYHVSGTSHSLINPHKLSMREVTIFLPIVQMEKEPTFRGVKQLTQGHTAVGLGFDPVNDPEPFLHQRTQSKSEEGQSSKTCPAGWQDHQKAHVGALLKIDNNKSYLLALQSSALGSGLYVSPSYR